MSTDDAISMHMKAYGHPSLGVPGTGRPAAAHIETCPHCGMHGSLVNHCGHPQSKFPDAPAGKCGLLECKVCRTHGARDGSRWFHPEKDINR